MLAGVSAEILSRIAATRSFLRVIENHENTSGGDSASKTGKGLVFVQNYSTYEYTINQSVRSLIGELNIRSMSLANLRVEILSMALNSEFTSVIDGALKRTWDNRNILLRKARSATTCAIHDTLFPKDGSHYRPKQLETIWTIFGILDPVVPEERLRSHIEEMVEHRNKIAHGVDPAESIGQRFTLSEISRRIDDTEKLCSYIIVTLSNYASNPNAFQ